MSLKDLRSRLHADLNNLSQNDLTIESAFRLMLEREQAIAAGESSIAKVYEKWFKGRLSLNCDGRLVSCEGDLERLAL